MDAEGLEHGGIYLQFEGERHHLDFRDLTGGRWVTIYAQTEIVKDLIRTRLEAGATIEFEVSDTEVGELDTERPVLRFTDAGGTRHEVVCDVIAGCDGFHGICRDSMPPGLIRVAEREYPYSWLGILASVPPSTDELIYCRHQAGFALHTMRTPQVSRLYLQVPADEDIGAWSDDRIWAELKHRLEVPGWELKEGHISEKAISPMRSFVASPMRYRRLFLAGDAAHIVPPTGAKGLNLAVADVSVLARAIAGFYAGDPAGLDAYSQTCLRRGVRGEATFGRVCSPRSPRALVALNLRTPIASIPPLAERIAGDLGLSAATTGLLTTLPVVCMGVFAPAGALAARRWGAARVLAGAVALILVGTALRLWPGAL